MPATRREFLKHSAMAATAAATLPATAPRLPLRPLGKTGVRVPILGLGGVGFLTDFKEDDAAGELLHHIIDAGVRYFDTAYNYSGGRSQQRLGLVMGGRRRRELFLASKVDDRTCDGAMRQFETSLKRLRTDYVDLIQIHHIDNTVDLKALAGRDGALTALQRLRDQKAARYIGMTGHPDYARVREALEMLDWDTFMGFVNPLASSRPALADQIPAAAKKGMGIIAMKVFGGSTPAMLVGDGPGKAPAADLLRYALSQPISIAIPAVSTRRQFDDNLAVCHALRPMNGDEQRALEQRVNRRA